MISRIGIAWIIGVVAATCVGCGGTAGPEPPAGGDAMVDRDLERRAGELASRMIIVDTHIDLPYRLVNDPADPGERLDAGDFDYPRAREGGLDVPFMSIYIPASHQQDGGARALADELIDMVEGIQTDHPDKFRIVTSVEQARIAAGDGLIGLALGIENGAAIEDELQNLSHFYERGVRYVTLTHSKHNRICDSSYDEEQGWGGLSEFT